MVPWKKFHETELLHKVRITFLVIIKVPGPYTTNCPRAPEYCPTPSGMCYSAATRSPCISGQHVPCRLQTWLYYCGRSVPQRSLQYTYMTFAPTLYQILCKHQFPSPHIIYWMKDNCKSMTDCLHRRYMYLCLQRWWLPYVPAAFIPFAQTNIWNEMNIQKPNLLTLSHMYM